MLAGGSFRSPKPHDIEEDLVFVRESKRRMDAFYRTHVVQPKVKGEDNQKWEDANDKPVEAKIVNAEAAFVTGMFLVQKEAKKYVTSICVN